MALDLPLGITISSHQADCLVIICIFIITNIVINFKHHRDLQDHSKFSKVYKQINPLFYEPLSEQDQGLKARFVRKIQHAENFQPKLERNETWSHRLSLSSTSCSCRKDDKTVSIFDFKKQSEIQQTPYQKLPIQQTTFAGSKSTAPISWKWPAGGIQAQPGQWVPLHGVMLTLISDHVDVYKIEISAKFGYLEFSRYPDMNNRHFDDDKYFQVKKLNEAEDHHSGFRFITLKSKNLMLLNQQLSFLIYRFPDSDKLNILSREDLISLTFNDDDKNQNVVIPVKVEPPNVPLLPLKSAGTNDVEKLISLVFVSHHASTSKSFREDLMDEFHKSRYKKVPTIVIDSTECSFHN